MTWTRGWCYQGKGSEAFHRTVAAALAWGGNADGEPSGWIKRAGVDAAPSAGLLGVASHPIASSHPFDVCSAIRCLGV